MVATMEVVSGGAERKGPSVALESHPFPLCH
jgi:hypothetical protein